MMTWSVNHPKRKIKPIIFRILREAFATSWICGWIRSAFFLTGLRDDADLIVQQSANRPSDVLGFAAAFAKIAL